MQENPENLAITLASSPNLPDKNHRNPPKTISLVEELLVKSTSPNEALDWARVREVILRQNEEVKKESHQRFLERTQFIYKISFAGVAFITGIVLFICGYKDAIYLMAIGFVPLMSIRKNH
jgi:hypothetical protein